MDFGEVGLGFIIRCVSPDKERRRGNSGRDTTILAPNCKEGIQLLADRGIEGRRMIFSKELAHQLTGVIQ